MFWKILATLGLVALNGYFVAAEFAAVGARQSRLETEAQTGGLLAKLSLEIKRKLDPLHLPARQRGMFPRASRPPHEPGRRRSRAHVRPAIESTSLRFVVYREDLQRLSLTVRRDGCALGWSTSRPSRMWIVRSAIARSRGYGSL